MTSQSTNLDLTYTDASDTSVTFQDFRTTLADSSGSNMALIDAFAGAIIDGGCIPFTTSGTSTAYTVTGLTLLDGSTTFPSTVPTGTKILLKPNVANGGVCTLQINSGDTNTLKKIYAQTDGVSDLQEGDLQTGKYYFFFFNGTAWILLDTVSLNQVVVDDAVNGDLTFDTTTNTYDIKAGAVSLTKIANVSSGSILGRSSTGSGVVEELTPADVISVLDLANALIYLGSIDCSTNPNYPTGNAGDLYIVSVAGKIGGASGTNVEIGDMVICNTDDTPSGDQATVGQYWDIIQGNLDGVVLESDFNANTILAADTDDTPSPLTVPEQTLVGRITSGNIDALTATEVRTLLNVEDGADVTDAANVGAAGAVMDSDFTQDGGIMVGTGAGAYQEESGATARASLGLVIGTDVEAADPDILKADTTDTLGVGYSTTPYNAGTKSTGTFTPDEANGGFQYAVNGGAHTVAPPTNNCNLVIQYTNNASAGTITTSGFTIVTGDALTTTDGDDFFMYITKNNGFSHLNVVALQ